MGADRTLSRDRELHDRNPRGWASRRACAALCQCFWVRCKSDIWGQAKPNESRNKSSYVNKHKKIALCALYAWRFATKKPYRHVTANPHPSRQCGKGSKWDHGRVLRAAGWGWFDHYRRHIWGQGWYGALPDSARPYVTVLINEVADGGWGVAGHGYELKKFPQFITGKPIIPTK